MQTLFEKHIIELLAEEDERAISLLYDHYGGTLYGIAFKVTQDEALAQDVLQDAFVKIWKSAGLYDAKKAKLFTWLYRIVQNTAIDAVRSRQRKGVKEIQNEDSAVYKLKTTSLQTDHLDLKKHASNLEHKYSEVIDALFFQGMTQQEASEELDIPLGTVKSRLKVGLRELRKLFGLIIIALGL